MYQISKLTENQLQIIQNALELYFRVQMGQLDQVAYTNLDKLIKSGNYADFRDDLEELRRKYNLDNRLEGDAAIACDIYQVIRHKLSWDRFPEGGIGVNFDTPLKVGEEMLCKIDKVNGL